MTSLSGLSARREGEVVSCNYGGFVVTPGCVDPYPATLTVTPNYKDAGSPFFVGFPKPWRFLRLQLERAMPKRLDEARVLAAVAADDLRGNATLLAATSRPCC